MICEVSLDLGLSSTIRQSSEKEVADMRGCGRGILLGFVRTPATPPFWGIFLSVRMRYMKSSWGNSWGLLESDWVFFPLMRASTAWVVVEAAIAIEEQLVRRVERRAA